MHLEHLIWLRAHTFARVWQSDPRGRVVYPACQLRPATRGAKSAAHPAGTAFASEPAFAAAVSARRAARAAVPATAKPAAASAATAAEAAASSAAARSASRAPTVSATAQPTATVRQTHFEPMSERTNQSKSA